MMPVNYVKDNAQCIQITMSSQHLDNHVYNISSGFTTSPRAQLQALLNVAPGKAEHIGLDPAELPDAAIDVGFNGKLFEKDFGWSSPYTIETALADYVRHLEINLLKKPAKKRT